MLDVIIFIAFTFSILCAIYYGTTRLLAFLFRRNYRNWVNQLYRNHSGVDLGRVRKFFSDEIMPSEDFSHWEMVAIFGLFLLNEEVTQVIKRAEDYGNQGWDQKYSYDFFSELANAAKRVSAKEEKEAARKLIMFGQRLAELYNKKDWAEQYWNLLNEEYAEETAREWDRSSRWRT